MTELPEMPGPVTVVLRDGTRVGVELVYDGLVNGIHRWLITSTISDSDLGRVEIGVLPAKSSVSFPMVREKP